MRRLRKSPLKMAISKYRRARTAHRADAHDARLTLFAKIFSSKIFLRIAMGSLILTVQGRQEYGDKQKNGRLTSAVLLNIFG